MVLRNIFLVGGDEMDRIKLIWSVLGLVFMSSTLYFGGKFLSATYSYLEVNKSTPAKIKEWNVIPLENGKYSVRATYEFFINKTAYVGQTEFEKPLFLNSDAAITQIKNWANQKWLAWYPDQNIASSTLERRFPLNLLFRFSLCLGLVIYHLWMKVRILSPYLKHKHLKTNGL